MILEGAAVAAAAGQIAPLVAQFLRERGNERGAVTEAAFRMWLQEEAFPRLLAESGQALKTLVSMKATETERYHRLESLLQDIRTAVTPAHAKAPDLSTQAIDILSQVIDSGTTEMIEMGYLTGTSYLLTNERSLIVQDSVFLADDLKTLVDQKYLTLDYNGGGDAVYRPTRRGAAFIAERALPKR